MSFGKFIYIWMRIICVISFLLAFLNLQASKLFHLDEKLSRFESALISHPVLPWVSIIMSNLIAQSSLVIQSMRILAMYSQSKRMKFFLCCLFLASTSCFAMLYAIFPLNLHRNSTKPGNFSLHPQWYMIISISSESILLSLVLYKAWDRGRLYHDFSELSSEHLLSVMVKDSIKFYVSIFVIYATTLVLIFLGPSEDSFANAQFSNAPILFLSTSMVGTLSPRLILNLRREYYAGDDYLQGGALRTLTWDADQAMAETDSDARVTCNSMPQKGDETP